MSEGFLHGRRGVDILASASVLALSCLGLSAPDDAQAREVAVSLDYGEVRLNQNDADIALLDGSVTLSGERGGFQLKAATEVPLDGDPAEGEVQLRYFRGVGSGATLVTGSRIDFGPGDDNAMLMVGATFELPIGFASEALLFIDENGHLLARSELVGTIGPLSRFLLQPKVEVNWSREGAGLGVGGGPEGIETALRIGYLLADDLTVYAGVIEGRTFGPAARQMKTDDESTRSTSLVIGISSAF